MTIYTDRLELAVLNEHQLYLLVNDMETLEKQLNINYKAEKIEGFFKRIVEGQLKITQSDPKNYQWHSFWLLIKKTDRIAVGSADFKDKPNQEGDVEIGYGLSPEFEGNGYMTEAVNGMINWALKQDGVKSIIAETENENLKSQNILKRCGFSEFKHDKTTWFKFKNMQNKNN